MVELQLEPPQDDIQRIDDPVCPYRVYARDGNRYPSVTSVLSVMDNMEWYDLWVARIGQAKADSITRIAGDRGTALHAACQHFICSDSPAPELMPDDLYRFALIKKELSKLEKVRAVEHKMVSDQYQVGGTADLIAYYGGKLTTFDYKSSNKPKYEDAFDSFWLQVAFYAIIWNETHPTELVTQLGIIPINDLDMTIKPRFMGLDRVDAGRLTGIRHEFRKRYKI